MAKLTIPGLKPQVEKKVSLTVKLDADLVARLEKTEERLAKEAKQAFTRSEFIEAKFEEFIDAVNKSLGEKK